MPNLSSYSIPGIFAGSKTMRRNSRNLAPARWIKRSRHFLGASHGLRRGSRQADVSAGSKDISMAEVKPKVVFPKNDFLKIKSLPAKVCAVCGEMIALTRRAAKDWDHVRYCSAVCRRIGIVQRRMAKAS
jgi:hypothetical protein